VGVVHVDHRPVLLGQGHDPVQGGDVPVHGEDPVGDDELEALGVVGLQELFQVVHVRVAVDQAGGLGEAEAVDDAGVVELVGEDQVPFPEVGERAPDGAHRPASRSPSLQVLLGLFLEVGVVGEAQVVVGGQVDHLFPLHPGHGLLGGLEDLGADVKPLAL